MTGDLVDELAFSARELEQLAAALTELAVRVRGAAAELGGPAARAGAEWIAAMDVDAGTATELAIDTRRVTDALEVYIGLPAELRDSPWSPWSPWSPPVRAGSGPRLAGTDGERAGPEQGIRVAQLPDADA